MSTVPTWIVRAHQLEFLVPEQIAEIDRAELPICDHAPTDCAFSSGEVGSSFFWNVAHSRIRLSASRQRFLQGLAAGGDDAELETGNGHAVAGLYDGVLRLAVQLGVCRLKALDLLAHLDVRTVIDVVSNRHPLRQLRHAANVIDVVVRGDEIVDAS